MPVMIMKNIAFGVDGLNRHFQITYLYSVPAKPKKLKIWSDAFRLC